MFCTFLFFSCSLLSDGVLAYCTVCHGRMRAIFLLLGTVRPQGVGLVTLVMVYIDSQSVYLFVIGFPCCQFFYIHEEIVAFEGSVGLNIYFFNWFCQSGLFFPINCLPMDGSAHFL